MPNAIYEAKNKILMKRDGPYHPVSQVNIGRDVSSTILPDCACICMALLHISWPVTLHLLFVLWAHSAPRHALKCHWLACFHSIDCFSISSAWRR